MGKHIKTLSLFSGAGGLDLGFHDAGYEIVACVELEEAYCATLRENVGHNRPLGEGVEVFCQDVNDFDASAFAGRGIECVIGGPPCQTFSAAGRRAGGVIGTADARGRLFERYCEILEIIKPRVFVFENVYGLPGANGGGPWRAIVEAFTQQGYGLRAEVLDAADYGVPQHRERLFMVGTREGEYEFPLPTHGPDSDSGAPLVSVRAAIADLQDSSEPLHDGLGGMYGHLLPLVPEGLNYSYFTAEMGHPEPQFAWRSKFHDLLYKVDPDAPARTLKAQPGKFTGPFHWKNRHFTLSELRRIQSFPDAYDIVGRYSQIVEQIGNSVAPRLAYVIAMSVREQLLRAVESQTFKVRPLGFRSTFRQRQRERSAKFKEIAQRAIEEQYPSVPKEAQNVAPLHEKYYLVTEGHFRRREVEIVRDLEDEQRAFSVIIQDSRTHLDIKVERYCAFGVVRGELNITGLKKYLGRIDSVTVSTALVDFRDIFHVWSIVEKALVRRSRFFSLIDIYGHYANRGDTVKVAADFGFTASDAIHRLLQFVSQSENCGRFISTAELRQELDLSEKEVDRCIASLRDERFDVRTKHTHPIIGNGRVIATYPFPLLSAKALVISRADIIDEEAIPLQLAQS